MMKFSKIALIAAVTLGLATSAQAGITWTVVATTSDASPLSAIPVGQQLILDITARTDDNAAGLGGSVNNYDNTVVGLNFGQSLISEALFVGFATGPGAGFGGLGNQRSKTPTVTAPLPFQEEVRGPNQEVEFFAGVNPTPAASDGTGDQGIVDGTVGAAQFRVVFDIIGTAGEFTTLDIGTFLAFGDAYTGTVDTNATNTSVSITVPEAGAVTSSLASLGAVWGVIALRRRD